MTTQLLDTMRELDSRTNDGIHVRMLWSEHDGRVAVAVSDAKTGDAFAIEVRAGDRALDVFHHPYAYAASRDIDGRALLAA
jgi:enolase